jgi:transmembrane sensor
LEGRVAVEPASREGDSNGKPDAAVTVLNPGQRMHASRKGLPTVERARVDRVTGWMRGQLIFDHTPLEEAAAEFNRYNKVKIVVKSVQAARIPIGGIFRIGDSESFAQAMAASYDLKISKSQDELLLESSESELLSDSDDTSKP